MVYLKQNNKVLTKGCSSSQNPVKSVSLGLFGLRELLFLIPAVILGLLPLAAKASTVNFDPLATIPTNTNGSWVYDYEKYGKTQLYIDFKNTEGVLLSMDAPFSPRDDFFAFRLQNSTNITVDKLTLDFIMPDGVALNNTPEREQWAFSVYHTSGLVQLDPFNADIVETVNSVSVELPFLDIAKWYPNETVYLMQNWDGFNDPRVDWLLSIDLNEKDNLAHTPIPGALWLFGTGLAGLLAASRAKRNG